MGVGGTLPLKSPSLCLCCSLHWECLFPPLLQEVMLKYHLLQEALLALLAPMVD